VTTLDETDRERAEDAAWRAAGAAALGLKEALARVGVLFPSLGPGTPVNFQGHVQLGGCNAGTATRLAELINQAADALPELRAPVR
jgi:hypothetical protein